MPANPSGPSSAVTSLKALQQMLLLPFLVPMVHPKLSCGSGSSRHADGLHPQMFLPFSSLRVHFLQHQVAHLRAGTHPSTGDLTHPKSNPYTMGNEGQWIKTPAFPATRGTVLQCLLMAPHKFSVGLSSSSPPTDASFAGFSPFPALFFEVPHCAF